MNKSGIQVCPLGLEEKLLLQELYKIKPFKSLSHNMVQNTLGWFYSLCNEGEVKAFAVTDDVDEDTIDVISDDIEYEVNTNGYDNIDYFVHDLSNLEDSCLIYAIEAIEETKGYGTELLNHLKEKNEYIVLIPTKSAEGYWRKQGFKRISNQYWLWSKE